MLNADDPVTFTALRRLAKIAADGKRPIILWVGAGASMWLNYPSWEDLARRFRRSFFEQVHGFDNSAAMRLIDKNDFPKFFQMCRSLDVTTYHRLIADSFAPRELTPAYKEFTSLLGEVAPLFIVTTNVDEMLEKSLPTAETVQRTDLERCIDLLHHRRSFVAKLHGSVSTVKSTVFTTTDYDALIGDHSYINLLKYIFTGATVLFLGYSVRDEYVINILQENIGEMEIFGPGPHFAVSNRSAPVSSIQRIGYSLKLRPDHSAAISVLNFVIPAFRPKGTVDSTVLEVQTVAPSRSVDFDPIPPGKTAYYISDLVPPGTWQTSEEITARRAGEEIEGSFGLGFTNDEVVIPVSTALHDIVVGLICFDYVFLPFSVMGSTHVLLGSELFWQLVQMDILRFIHSDTKLGVVFRKGEALGVIADVVGGTNEGPEPAPLSVLIRKTLRAAPGQEKVAETLFDILERKTVIYKGYKEVDVPSLVRGALLMPAVSRLLGVGDAILPSQVPRWLRYPYLRLAHLVQTGVLCTEYGIQAAKVPFGGVQLTAATFGLQEKDSRADHVASYVSTGTYNSDLGALVFGNMTAMKQLMVFRTSVEGDAFRREIANALAAESGREFNAAVNAGLSQALPITVVQRAQDRLLKLMTESERITRTPAVWAGAAASDVSTRYWRGKSRALLVEMCRTRKISRNDSCICGSGEKLRLCCLAPLESRS